MMVVYCRSGGSGNNQSLLLLLLPLFIFFQTSAVNPGCRCVRYTSTWGKEWALFSSPDYPLEYPRPTRCLLYSFSAPPGFIVHLNFERIALPPPATSSVSSAAASSNNNNGCTDFLKLFIHVDEVHGGHGHHGVNENTPWTRLLCGNSANLSYHSSSRHLIIQFHASDVLSPGTSSGSPGGTPFSFIGRYRFLNSSQFVSTGRLMTGTKCDYQFVGRDEVESGRFFSPHYPSTYPYNIRCAYHFYASLHKRVKITFEAVSLQAGDYSCLNKTDVIRVLDGSNPNAPVIALICNSVENLEVLSSGPHAQVEFLANSDNPGNGFRGTYHYIEVQLDNSWDNSRLLSSDLLNGQDGLPQASTLVPQCNQVITSDAGRNGSFSSPNYPHYYTPKTQCRYVFLGHGKERVQIHFTDFWLFHPSDGNSSPTTNNNYLNPNQIKDEVWTNRRCTEADVLSVWIHANGHLEKIVELCGKNPPPQIMSNSHRLTLELHSIASANFARGFYATYAFVEDFGIKTGRQLEDYPCGFVYNSSERQEGTFWSPNYPGSYPRDTECHYFFYGLVNFERVLLTFNSFHLSGSKSSCEDYIELSNFMGVDRMYSRRCGSGKEKDSMSTSASFRVLSKSHFFRVTFRSSGASRSSPVSGTGFHGSYRFTSEDIEDLPPDHHDDPNDDEMNSLTPTASSSLPRSPPSFVLLFVALLMMMVSVTTPTTTGTTPSLVIRRHILLLMVQILEK